MFSVKVNYLAALICWCIAAVAMLAFYSVTDDLSYKGFARAAALPIFIYMMASAAVIKNKKMAYHPGFVMHLFCFFLWVSLGFIMQPITLRDLNADPPVANYWQISFWSNYLKHISIAGFFVTGAFLCIKANKHNKAQIKRNLIGCQGVLLDLRDGVAKVKFGHNVMEKIQAWPSVIQRKWALSSADTVSTGDWIEVIGVDDDLKTLTAAKLDPKPKNMLAHPETGVFTVKWWHWLVAGVALCYFFLPENWSVINFMPVSGDYSTASYMIGVAAIINGLSVRELGKYMKVTLSTQIKGLLALSVLLIMMTMPFSASLH